VTRGWKITLTLSLVLNLAIVYVAYKALEYRAHINEFRDKYLNVVNEFSGREIHLESNLELRSDTVVPCRVVFLGTQVTQNWDLAEYFPDYNAINRAISGQRMAGFLLRFRSDVISLGPEAVVIELSSYHFRPNLAVEEIEEYTTAMADLAASNNIVPLLTTVVPPIDDFEIEDHPDYRLIDSVAAFNRWLRKYCEQEGLTCADLASAVTDDRGYLKREFSVSPVDLNEAGYDRIAGAVRAALDSVTQGCPR
jgi:lysophospholipase L1-like esterase